MSLEENLRAQVRLAFFNLHVLDCVASFRTEGGWLLSGAVAALASDGNLIFLVGIHVAVAVQIDRVMAVDA
jgi:hypothetical protein